jgi:hypothetical protein
MVSRFTVNIVTLLYKYIATIFKSVSDRGDYTYDKTSQLTGVESIGHNAG